MTIYLKLMHGRDDPDRHMADWGFDGPVLGPFEVAHFTYATHVRCFPKGSGGDAEALELCYRDDMLVHDGNITAISRSPLRSDRVRHCPTVWPPMHSTPRLAGKTTRVHLQVLSAAAPGSLVG